MNKETSLSKHRVLIFLCGPESTSRALDLANELRGDYDIGFVGPESCRNFLAGHAFHALSSGFGASDPSPDELEKAFLETSRLLREIRPEWVVGERAIPLAMAAEFAHVPRCALWAKDGRGKVGGETSKDSGFHLAVRGLRRRYGLRTLGSLREEEDGDLNVMIGRPEDWTGSGFPPNVIFLTSDPEARGRLRDAFLSVRRRTVCVYCRRGRLDTSRDIRTVPGGVRRYANDRFTFWRCASCGAIHLVARTDVVADPAFHPKRRRTVDFIQLQLYSNFIRLLKKNGLGRMSRILLVGADARLGSAILALHGYRRVEIIPGVEGGPGDPEMSPLFPVEPSVEDSGGNSPTTKDPEPKGTSFGQTFPDFSANEFDGAILLDALARSNDPRALLEYTTGLVRKDGTLIVIDPVADGLSLSKPERDRMEFEAPYRRHIVSETSLVSLVRAEGLSLVRLRRRVFFDTWKPFTNHRFIVALSRLGDGTEDAAIHPPSLTWRHLWKLPWLAALAFFGRVIPYQGIVTAVFRKSPLGLPLDEVVDTRLDPATSLRDIVGLNLGPVSVLTRRSSVAEARFICREIFKEDCYFRNGIVLPPGATVIDVGANIGLFSLGVMARCPESRLLCFEPVPETFQLLKANLTAHASRRQRVRLCRLAVSNLPGSREITYYPGMPGNSTLSPEGKIWQTDKLFGHYTLKDAWRWNPWMFLGLLLIYPLRGPLIRFFGWKGFVGARTLSIHAVTLDQVFRTESLSVVDLLKIDAEGEEMAILQGLSDENLGRVRALVIEVDVLNRPGWPALRERLEKAGFNRIVVENPRPTAPGYPDVVYATRGGAVRC